MAYYNMDKRSDGARCRRSLTSTSRLDPISTVNPAGLKEDKIRFLLEAAEAARGGGTETRLPVPAAPSGPFVGMSLGQYVNALSSCLPVGAGIRPLLWNANQPFQTPPHDALTSHAALLPSLAAASTPPVQSITSTTSLPVPDRSLINSLLASYATGSPLFSIGGLQYGNGRSGSPNVVGTSPVRCFSSESPTAPQDLSMSVQNTSDTRLTESEITDFLAATTPSFVSSSLASGGHTSAELANGSLSRRERTEGSVQLSNGWHVKIEDEEATDLSVKNVKTSEITYQKSGMVPDATAGTVDLSARAAERKPTPCPNVDQKPDPASLQMAPGDSRLIGYIRSGCCDDDAGCPHLLKLKELRRNVYRMLSVFTPYLDVAGAGIADVEADGVDRFLHEVIYSSKLDQASTD